MGPMFRDFFVKNRPIWAARPRIAFLWKYPPPGVCPMVVWVHRVREKQKKTWGHWLRDRILVNIMGALGKNVIFGL